LAHSPAYPATHAYPCCPSAGGLLKGYKGCAAITDFSSVSCTVGSSDVDLSTWIGGIIPVGWFTNWIVGDVVQALLTSVIK